MRHPCKKRLDKVDFIPVIARARPELDSEGAFKRRAEQSIWPNYEVSKA